uniref:J domain-containing protein n=1 Tax=Zooxanthella nutricula TaxID=1333877 RepID=A0A7S2L1V6_9DINO
MRLLRLLVVGFVIDARREQDPKPAAREGKPKKKGGKAASWEAPSMSIGQVREKCNVYGGPLLMLLFTCALFGARIAGEDFSPDTKNDEVNLFEVLGVPHDASVLDVRKAYKHLALSWHPDKNPGCEACATRFAKISQAYEVLNNPEKRKAYEARRAPEGSLESMASVDLTADDFEARVARSNDVWYVQVYDPTDGLCQHFHALWEDVAHRHEDVARFGRIDLVKHRRVVSLLPQRVGMVPLVFRFARGHEPVIFQSAYSSEDRGSAPFARFVQDNFPEVRRIGAAAELRSWWDAGADRQRILLASPAGGFGRRTAELMQALRLAHMWHEFFDFAVADAKLASDALGSSLPPGALQTPGAWAVVARAQGGAGGRAEVKEAAQLRDLSGAMQELISRSIGHEAPHATLRNYQQLCGALGMRTFCLFLVDNSVARVPVALEELGSSRTSFLQEAAELRSEDEEATEEPFHIQPIRVTTSSSRLPWLPVAPGASFKALWAAADKAPSFVLELETRRVAPVKTASFRELYQQIAYDDLKFRELPEGLSLARSLPDPEVTLGRELLHGLATLQGSLLAFLLAAAAIAVVPELSLPAVGAVTAVAASLIAGAWPLACRRCIAIVWCGISPGRFECLVGG